MTRGEAAAATRPWGVALIAGIVGGLLGALIPVLVRTGASQPAEITGLDALDRHVQELTAELRGRPIAPSTMPQRLDADVEPRDAPIEPLQPSATADLQAVVVRLDALVGRLETSADALAGSRPLTIPDTSVTEAARQALIDAKKHASLPDELYLMNYQQVLERYGRPSAISGFDMGKVRWTYLDRLDSNQRTALIFVGGLVSDWDKN